MASREDKPFKIGLKNSEKNHLLNKIIRVETKEQTSEIQLLKKELKALKEAYAEAMLELKVHQEIIKVSDQMLGTDLKKSPNKRY